MHGEHYEPRAGKSIDESSHCFESAQPRHRDVAQNRIGPQAQRCLHKRFPVGDCSDDIEVVLEQTPEGLEEEIVVIGEKQTWAES
jgi:hypothetical protein